MRKDMICKTLSTGIVILFIGICIIPSSGIQIDNKSIIIPTNSGNTLYVGGNGSGNYSKIQDAIYDASDGDTVFVYDDSSPYNEWNIQVNKSINLIGEDRNTTIIDGQYQDSVIKLTADGITIAGFTIRKCKTVPLEHYGAILTVGTNNHTIVNNKLCGNNDSGINFEKSHYNFIYGNYIVDNWIHGIWLFKSGNNFVSNNIIVNSDILGFGAGIRVQRDNATNNTIKHNYIINNNRGILVQDASSNKVFNNTVKNNRDGIEVSGKFNNITNNKLINNSIGIILSGENNKLSNNNISKNNLGIVIHSINSIITKNDIINTHWRGISIYSESNIILDNTIESTIREGIRIQDAKFNIIKDNNIKSNGEFGIYSLRGEYNVILGNTISYNKLQCIYFNESCSNMICYNNISFNNGTGVYLFCTSTNNFVRGNNISNNLQSFYITNISNFNNNIYHNNFLENKNQPCDKSNNYWDDSYPSGGNYWDDYNGTDNDGDGIGDIPYNITGGSNQDNYPLMQYINNQGPTERPLIGGRTNGKTGAEYTYTFITVDPDDDEVYYYIDWGDNTSSGWIGPYSSGKPLQQVHQWSSSGTYIIKAKAKDIDSAESGWSELEIIITKKSKSIENNLFLRFLERYPLLNLLLQRLIL